MQYFSLRPAKAYSLPDAPYIVLLRSGSSGTSSSSTARYASMPAPFPAGTAAPPFHIFIRNSCLIYSLVSKTVIFPCPRTYTITKTNSEVIYMKQGIRKIVTGSALFFGILAVSTAGIQVTSWRNAQNAPVAVTTSAAQSPVIVLDAGHGIN